MNAMSLRVLGESVQMFWQERKPRERTMLTLAAVVIVLVLFYAVLIGPALKGRTQLETSLPSLRQQAAEFQALARHVAQLAQAGSTAPPVVAKEAIEASLTQKGLKAQSVVLSGELTRVQLASVSFSALLEWLEEMQQKARLSVAETTVAALPAPDTVNATVTLRRPPSGGRGD